VRPLKIIGGVYREICQFPERREIFGSGGRAAAALATLNEHVELHCFVPESRQQEVAAGMAAFAFSLVMHPSDDIVSFRYLHGLASPIPQPALNTLRQAAAIELHGDVILRYGMVEGDAVVKAKRAIYDPQNPLSPVAFALNGSSAQELAYVINSGEAALLSGTADEVEQLRWLHGTQGAAIVVLKQGPHGALVSVGKTTTRVPAFKTSNVWPIGSGDVFSAVFAHFWGACDYAPEKAALLASQATAYYCDNSVLPIPGGLPDQYTYAPVQPAGRRGRRPRLYLAGPFFTVSQHWLIETLRETFFKLDLDVFSPIHDVGDGPAEMVAKEDLNGLDGCDVVFAVCDGLDAGTLVEVGYAVAKNIPVVAFTQVERDDDLTMLIGTGCNVQRDLVTAAYHAVWTALER
jgi:hypothetical protein